MLCRSYNRFLVWLVLISCLAVFVRAQVPDTVLVVKLAVYRQKGSSDVQEVGAKFGAQLSFAVTPPSSTSVQLRTPNGNSSTLTRQADGSFAIERDFASGSALDAQWPDGNYVIAVTGGTSATNTTISVATGAAIPPVMITNFETLQASPGPFADFRWDRQLVPGPLDFGNIAVERDDGVEIFSTDLVSSSSAFQASNLPLFTPLNGVISFARFDVTPAASGAMAVAAGRGFELRFPFRCVTNPPIFLNQPRSQVASPSGSFELNALASGQGPISYQWKKDGVPIPGAAGSVSSSDGIRQIGPNFRIANVQLSDAGVYTVEVSNAAGTTRSDAVTVSVSSTFAGTIYAGSYGSLFLAVDGARTATARLAVPGGLAFDRKGTLYFVDRHAIRKITSDGNVVTVAGSASESGGADGLAGTARFNSPWGLAVDSNGNIFVSDWFNFAIRKISPSGIVSTFAGGIGVRGFANGNGSSARFDGPLGLAIDAADNLYVADRDSSGAAIRRISSSGEVSTYFSASSAAFKSLFGDSVRVASFEHIAIGAGGDVFASDTGNRSVVKIKSTGETALFAFGVFKSVAVDSMGNVYLSNGPSVSRLNPDGAIMGSGNLYRGVPGTDSQSGIVSGLAVGNDGKIYAALHADGVIVQATLVTGTTPPHIEVVTSPRSHVIPSGGSVMLSVAASGPNLRYQWMRNGSAIPEATNSQIYVPNMSAEKAGDYTVVVSNGMNSTVSAASKISLSSTEDVGRLVNLSIRSQAGTGSQTLIVGFTVGGGTNVSKPLLLRGIGPALAPFGVSDYLSDPSISLIAGAQTITRNDNWDGSAALSGTFSSVGAFALLTGSRDAASTATLSSGSYSLVLSGNGNTTGVALAEIYELPAEPSRGLPRLTNVSARTQVGKGGNILIAGLVVGGQTSRTLLIRAAGGSLLGFGVSGVLTDPQIKIYSGTTELASNDDWSYDFTTRTVAASIGAFELSASADSALLITLPPGGYTVQVSGANGGTGVGLAEVYEVP